MKIKPSSKVQSITQPSSPLSWLWDLWKSQPGYLEDERLDLVNYTKLKSFVLKNGAPRDEVRDAPTKFAIVELAIRLGIGLEPLLADAALSAPKQLRSVASKEEEDKEGQTEPPWPRDLPVTLSSNSTERASVSTQSSREAESAHSWEPIEPEDTSDPRFAKYLKMIRVGVPKPLVLMKFAQETGLPPQLLDRPKALAAQRPRRTMETDERYAKFFKMIRIGLPFPLIELRFTQETGLDAALLLEPGAPIPEDRDAEASAEADASMEANAAPAELAGEVAGSANDSGFDRDGAQPSLLQMIARVGSRPLTTAMHSGDQPLKRLTPADVPPLAVDESRRRPQPEGPWLLDSLVASIAALFAADPVAPTVLAASVPEPVEPAGVLETKLTAPPPAGIFAAELSRPVGDSGSGAAASGLLEVSKAAAQTRNPDVPGSTGPAVRIPRILKITSVGVIALPLAEGHSSEVPGAPNCDDPEPSAEPSNATSKTGFRSTFGLKPVTSQRKQSTDRALPTHPISGSISSTMPPSATRGGRRAVMQPTLPSPQACPPASPKLYASSSRLGTPKGMFSFRYMRERLAPRRDNFAEKVAAVEIDSKASSVETPP